MTTRPPGLEDLSPFQLKDELIRQAKSESAESTAAHKFLNAGRGNPNWVATTPRESFFLLGDFALGESKRVWNERDLGGMPERKGIADRFREFLAARTGPGALLLRDGLKYAIDELALEPDAFVHELTDGIIGDNYPEPDRMLVHAEQVVQRYLAKTMCDGRPPAGTLDLFAVEGGTAAMCYVFGSLRANRLLRAGDTIALGTPIFTPYIELPALEDFALPVVNIEQGRMADAGHHAWQYSDAEIDKLADPKVKAFFLVNPSNPASFAMDPATQARLVKLVKTKRPDLIILTDDVYGTFAEGFRSLAADLPRNTILVYSYSKHFGCTGWRLGVIGLNQDNILDEKLASLSESDRTSLRARYSSLSMNPEGMKFIDRLVADSRDVALNHTAGLSLPQQVQMTLFSLFALLDRDDAYQRRCRAIVQERLSALSRGLGLEIPADPLRIAYYVTLDLEVWGRQVMGEEFVRYVAEHRAPIDLVMNLAKRHGTVLLNGSGFDGPPWSVRISLANLEADAYEAIGRDLKAMTERAVSEWRRGKEG